MEQTLPGVIVINYQIGLGWFGLRGTISPLKALNRIKRKAVLDSSLLVVVNQTKPYNDVPDCDID